MAEFYASRQLQSAQARAGLSRRRPAPGNVRVFKIYRFDPEIAENPRLDTYEVDMDTCGPMVLDALIKIKNEIDTTLSFRRSCREGICGSCAMNIDGKNAPGLHQRLRRRQDATSRSIRCRTCRSIKDLVPDLTNFYAQYASIKPWLQTRTPPPPDGERLQSKEDQEKVDRPSACILVRLLLDQLSELLVEQRALSRACGAAGRLPLDRRQPRRGGRRAARRSRGSVSAVSLPHHHELHRGLPQGPESRQGDR